MKGICCKVVFLLIPVFLLFSNSCNKDNVIKIDRLSGYVQKGPFLKGATVEMFELNSSLEHTGKVFKTSVTDNSGSFEIKDVSLSSQLVELSASGAFFDETAGGVPANTLNLMAISDITDKTTVNINILTNLERERVKKLVREGMVFSLAKDSAQAEILALFGLKVENPEPSEFLNISKAGPHNSILLAVSMILQGRRIPSDLSVLLNKISNDLKEDGVLTDESIKANLRNAVLEIDPAKVRSNLVERYHEMGIDATIPEFEKYLFEYMAMKASAPVAWNRWVTEINASGATLNGRVNPNSLSTVVTFEYGTSTNFENTAIATQSPLSGYLTANVNAKITGLSIGTTYYYRIKAVNSIGTTYSAGWQFTR